MRGYALPVLGLSALLASTAAPAAIGPELIGLRGASSAATIPQDIDMHELFLRFTLPWQKTSGSWRIASHLNLGAGRLDADDRSADIFSIGPSVSFSRGRFTIDLGTAPTYLSDTELAGRKMGGHFQFTSHLALYVQLTRLLSTGVRIQHTSNASIYPDNDGLDLQAFEVWVRF